MAYDTGHGTEPVDTGMLDALASTELWNVPAGCAVTPSGINMTFDVTAGAVVINGLYVPVVAQTGVAGLASDGTNPRWAWLWINTSGTAGVTLGTAAANPVVPAWDAAKAFIALYKVDAGQTIASSSSVKLDKRVPGAFQYQQTTTDFTKTNNTTMSDVTGLSFFVGANEKWVWEIHAPVSVNITPCLKLLYTYPAGATINGGAELISAASIAAFIATGFNPLTPVLFASLTSEGITLHTYGHIENGATAGIVQLQAAQRVADAATVTIFSRSWVQARRVG